jgi:4-hydroxyproline epimerase
VILEPRGGDAWVGAWIAEASQPDCATRVVFFNNVGYIGMCGHGTIGLMVTLRHLRRLTTGCHRVETPVGVVVAEIHDDARVTVENVPSYRFRRDVPVVLDDGQSVTGDIAWGGNWFFLVRQHDQILDLDRVDQLTVWTMKLRAALRREAITGERGAEIDHIELFAPSPTAAADSRNFVLCPGGAFDRSPCGTGTSAKLACLAADGQWEPGAIYRQEGITGSIFTASYQWSGERIVPRITGEAYVTAESTLVFSAEDPFRTGIGR